MTLPENWTPLEAVTITKCLDEDGDVRLHHEATDGLNTWEALGMCLLTAQTLKDSWGVDDD